MLAVLSSRLTGLCSEDVLTNLFCSSPKEQQVGENSVPSSPRRAQEGLGHPHTQWEPPSLAQGSLCSPDTGFPLR